MSCLQGFFALVGNEHCIKRCTTWPLADWNFLEALYADAAAYRTLLSTRAAVVISKARRSYPYDCVQQLLRTSILIGTTRTPPLLESRFVQAL
jgi:hypothetical protein